MAVRGTKGTKSLYSVNSRTILTKVNPDALKSNFFANISSTNNRIVREVPLGGDETFGRQCISATSPIRDPKSNPVSPPIPIPFRDRIPLTQLDVHPASINWTSKIGKRNRRHRDDNDNQRSTSIFFYPSPDS